LVGDQYRGRFGSHGKTAKNKFLKIAKIVIIQ